MREDNENLDFTYDEDYSFEFDQESVSSINYFIDSRFVVNY